MLRTLAACAVLCACLCGGSPPPAGECRSPDDGVALHQRAVRLHSKNEDRMQPLLPPPGKLNFNRRLIRESVDGGLHRATSRLNLPETTAIMRWALVGKVTEFLTKFYSSRKTPAMRGLVDDMVLFAHDVFGRKDVLTADDMQLFRLLANLTRTVEISRRFVDRMESPHVFLASYMDAVAKGAKGDLAGAMHAATGTSLHLLVNLSRTLVNSVNKTSPAWAEMLAYTFDVGFARKALDYAHVLDLFVPILRENKVPTAVTDYVGEDADLVRRSVSLSPNNASSRIMRMLSAASRQLHMPPAVAELFDTMAKAALESPLPQEKAIAVQLRINELLTKLNAQVDGPPAVSELISRLGAPLHGQSLPGIAEGYDLVAQASDQLGMPGATGEIIRYAGSVLANEKPLNASHFLDLQAKLGRQLGASEATANYASGLASLVGKDGSLLDEAQAANLVSTLLDKMGLQSLHILFMLSVNNQDKFLDPETLGKVLPVLSKAPSEVAQLITAYTGMRDKFFAPLDAALNHTTAKLFGHL